LGAQGLVIDAAATAAAEAALAAGAEQMSAGRLEAALAQFGAAAAGVPLRSRLGGEASLQRAICLDSMVRTRPGGRSRARREAPTGAAPGRAARPRPRRCTSPSSGTRRPASPRKRATCCLASRRALAAACPVHARQAARRARRRGAQAMDNLKTHSMSYGVGSAYDAYFARLSGQWASYVAPDGEQRGGVDALLAAAIILAPILAVGVKIAGRLAK